MTTSTNETTNDDSCFRMRINKVSEWTEVNEIFSDKKEIMGFPWSVCFRRNIENNEITAFLFSYKDDESNVWYCHASMECTLVNHNEGGENHKWPSSAIIRFSHEKVLAVDVKLDTTNLLENPELGFVKDDSIIVVARITVHSTCGNRFRKKMEYDMFSPSNISDGILIVEGKKVYVSKQLLAINSRFFNRLFYGEFKEANESETEIQDVGLGEIIVLLKMIYRTGEPFSDITIECILKLADRFEMLGVLDDAEKYLLGENDTPLHRKFRLADQYNLVMLQDQLLPQYTDVLIRELKRSHDYTMLKEETRNRIFEMYIEFTTPK